MDELNKFGDFFDDEIVEVDSIDENENIPTVVGVPVNRSDSDADSEEEVQGALEKLTKKYNLDPTNVSIKGILENIDEINSDDSSFDLVASKIVTDYVGRVALRAVITETNMINKVLTLMDKTSINAINGDSLLALSKVFEYQDRLFAILDRYKKAGVNTSLKHIAESKSKEKEEKITLTPDEIRRLVSEINKKKEEDEDE